MITKEIEIIVDTSDADKSVKGLDKNINKLDDSIQDMNDSVVDTGKKSTKSFDAAEKSAKGASLGVRAIGTALTAIGIGAVIAIFAKFTEVLTSNEKISNALSAIFGTIGIVLTDIVDAVVNTFTAVSKATNGFEGFRKVIDGLVTLALSPLKLSFFAVKLVLQEAQLAWEQSFFGDKDQKTITDLTKKITATKLEIASVTIEAVKAGSQVVNNFGKAVNEVVTLGATGISNLGKVSITSAYEQSKANVALQNSAIIAAAQLEGLIEKYDVQAEKLRQIRDDDQLSIAERIKANEALGKVLDEQNQKQKELARVQIAAAVAAKKTATDKVAAQAEIIRATNELAAIEAQVEGFRSEQLVNRNSLEKERIEILRELNEIGKNELELAKSEAQQLRDDRIKQIELQVEDENEKFRLLAAARKDFDDTITRLDEEEKERLKKIEDEKIKSEKESSNNTKEIIDLEMQARLQAVNNLQSISNAAEEILGKSTQAGKAVAVATTLTNTYSGATAAYNTQFVPGDPSSVVRGAIAAAAVVASGLANVKRILAVKINGQSGGSGGNNVSGGDQQAQPAFNLTGRSNVNQLQTGLEQQETAPVRAFVVGSNVTSQQEADRATRGQASFG